MNDSDKANELPGLGLIVVDMQEGFLRPIPEAEALTRRVSFSIHAARLLGVPVFLTEQVPEKLGPTIESIREAAPDAPVFPKTAFSGFGAEGLNEALRVRGIHHVLLAGIETPICIYQTALGALAEELEVTLLSDATGCRRAEDVAPVQAMLRQAGAHILPSETVFYAAVGDATHGDFRAFTKLVKEYS